MTQFNHGIRIADWQLGLPAREHLERLARESASRLATAEAALEAVSDDVDARGTLVSEIDALDRDIKEKAVWRARAAEKLAALRAIEPDARLEEREAVALSARELARARARKAAADLDALLDVAAVEDRLEVR